MEQTLHDYIKNNEDLRQVLMLQEGGIMKYWAENPDAEFDADLFDGYENQIVKAFVHANKLNRAVRSLSADELREKSLDWYHHSKGSELKFYVAIKPMLNAIDAEFSEQALKYIEIYMADAYKVSHRYRFPAGMPLQDFYNKVIEIYGMFGLALECLEQVLGEYRGKVVKIAFRHYITPIISTHARTPEWEEECNLQTDFDIRMFREIYFAEGGYKKLRQAVKEIIGNIPLNLTRKEYYEECRKLAKDEMGKVNQFTRWVYNKTYPMNESEKGTFVPLITSEERLWLQNIMYDNSPGATGTKKLTSMGTYFSFFLHLLQNVGTYWAAQLLVRGIDMKELEEETGINLSKLPDTMYYVDRGADDRFGDYCIGDWAKAKKLLDKIKSRKVPRVKVLTWEDEKKCFKEAVLHVFELKKNEGNFLFENNTQWMAVYRYAVDSGIMYDMDDPNEPKDTNIAQYAKFSDFVHELQLDVDPAIRIPFKKDYIASLSKTNYARYNTKYPWLKEGITDPRSEALYKQMEDVYLALETKHNILVFQTERIVG